MISKIKVAMRNTPDSTLKKAILVLIALNVLAWTPAAIVYLLPR